jgi:hypothetical protein
VNSAKDTIEQGWNLLFAVCGRSSSSLLTGADKVKISGLFEDLACLIMAYQILN